MAIDEEELRQQLQLGRAAQEERLKQAVSAEFPHGGCKGFFAVDFDDTLAGVGEQIPDTAIYSAVISDPLLRQFEFAFLRQQCGIFCFNGSQRMIFPVTLAKNHLYSKYYYPDMWRELDDKLEVDLLHKEASEAVVRLFSFEELGKTNDSKKAFIDVVAKRYPGLSYGLIDDNACYGHDLSPEHPFIHAPPTDFQSDNEYIRHQGMLKAMFHFLPKGESIYDAIDRVDGFDDETKNKFKRFVELYYALEATRILEEQIENVCIEIKKGGGKFECNEFYKSLVALKNRCRRDILEQFEAGKSVADIQKSEPAKVARETASFVQDLYDKKNNPETLSNRVDAYVKKTVGRGQRRIKSGWKTLAGLALAVAFAAVGAIVVGALFGLCTHGIATPAGVVKGAILGFEVGLHIAGISWAVGSGVVTGSAVGGLVAYSIFKRNEYDKPDNGERDKGFVGNIAEQARNEFTSA